MRILRNEVLMKRWTELYIHGTDYGHVTVSTEPAAVIGDRYTYKQNTSHEFTSIEEGIAWLKSGTERTLELGYRCPECKWMNGIGQLCTLCAEESRAEWEAWMDSDPSVTHASDKKALKNIQTLKRACPCSSWAWKNADIGLPHHPYCDGTGRNKIEDCWERVEQDRTTGGI